MNELVIKGLKIDVQVEIKELECKINDKMIEIKDLENQLNAKKSKVYEFDKILEKPYYLMMLEAFKGNKNLVNICCSYIQHCMDHGIYVYRCVGCLKIGIRGISSVLQYTLQGFIIVSYEHKMFNGEIMGIIQYFENENDKELYEYWQKSRGFIMAVKFFDGLANQILDGHKLSSKSINVPRSAELVIYDLASPIVWIPCIFGGSTTISFIIDK